MRFVAFVVAGALTACSGNPVKEPAIPPAASATPEVKIQVSEPKIPRAAKSESSKAVTDPLSDPNSQLAKRSIYYDFDSSIVDDRYRPIIQAHANYLVSRRDAKILVEGNCDERGSREYNLALGQRRADAVKSVLKLLGVADTQITTMSWGEEKPKSLGHDGGSWSENRRSDIIYTISK